MESFECLNKVCELSEKEYVVSHTLKEYQKCQQRWGCFISKLQYIFVGDNPGDVEKKYEEYFYYDDENSSQTGINTHNFIENFLGVNEKEILFLNKSLKSTKTTEELYVHNPVEDKSLSLMAELIKAITVENNKVFVCIFGIDSFDAEYFKPFFSKLSISNNIGLYPHPSRRQPISLKEQDEIKDILDKRRIFELYGEFRHSDETCRGESLIYRCKKEIFKNDKDKAN